MNLGFIGTGKIASSVITGISHSKIFVKKILVYTLIIAAILIFPFLPFSNLKILKHILEWNYFLGVITFYLLTYFMWKK